MDKSIINRYIQLDYIPSAPKYFYLYNEIYNEFLKNHKCQNILTVGVEHGFIETLNYLKLLTHDTKINFVGTQNSTRDFENYMANDSILSINKNIRYTDILTPKLYDLLVPSYLADTIIFNYFALPRGFNFNFVFTQTIIKYVPFTLNYKPTPGGFEFK